MHPFFGAGLQYNIKPFCQTAPIYNDGGYNYSPQAGTKCISILFTQGVTFEINTKIEIGESFHFIPNNNNRVIGIDLGIGYKIN